MGKKSDPIDTINMTFVGRPSEDSIRKFVKQVRELDEILQQIKKKKSEVVK